MWDKFLQIFRQKKNNPLLVDKKILVIDDGVAERTLMTRVLADHGCRVITAADGITGLENAALQHPDLIFLDYMMPGIDGKEVCKRLKSDAQTKHIPVIFLTGSTKVVDCYDAGADYYLAKPISTKALIKQLEQTFQETSA